MKNEEMKKLNQNELDDNALDTVSGGFVEELVPPDVLHDIVGAIEEE